MQLPSLGDFKNRSSLKFSGLIYKYPSLVWCDGVIHLLMALLAWYFHYYITLLFCSFLFSRITGVEDWAQMPIAQHRQHPKPGFNKMQNYLKRMPSRTQAKSKCFIEWRLSVMPAYPGFLLNYSLLGRDIDNIQLHIQVWGRIVQWVKYRSF